jgi:hypothetical protein
MENHTARKTYELNVIAAKQDKVIKELYKGHKILSTGNRGMKIKCYDNYQIPFWVNLSYNHNLTNYYYYETSTEYSDDWMMEQEFNTFEELLNYLK